MFVKRDIITTLGGIALAAAVGIVVVMFEFRVGGATDATDRALTDGASAAEDGDFDAALKYFTTAAVKAPNDHLKAVALSNRGCIHRRAGRPQEALDDLNAAIDLDGQDATCRYNRGVLFQSQEKDIAALVDFCEAIRLDPSMSSAYANRAIILAAGNKLSEAIDDLTTAIKLTPDKPLLYFNRGATWEDAGKSERAIEDYTRAIELDPTFIAAYQNRGWSRMRLRHFEAAAADFSQIIRITEGKQARGFVNRCVAYKELGEIDDALADISAAISIEPDTPSFYGVRAALYRIQGDEARRQEDKVHERELAKTAIPEQGRELAPAAGQEAPAGN